MSLVKNHRPSEPKMNHFGTDGIRRSAADFTPDFLAKIAKGLVDYGGNNFNDDGSPKVSDNPKNFKVFLAGDSRESSEWIIADLESAFESFGIEYASAGILPTPAICHCFFDLGFDFAIDITASHNPASDNGIKIFERGKNSGEKLSEQGRKIIENALNSTLNVTPVAKSLRENLFNEAREIYIEHLKTYIEPADFSNLHFALDCANGATSVVGKSIFESFGAKVEELNVTKNYNLEINQSCGSTHPEALQSFVQKNSLAFGAAFDGDGDRCLFVDDRGELVDGDEILAIFANFLHLDALATTVMANQGLLNWAKSENKTLAISAVGDSNVAVLMKEKNLSLGGEQSGHIILPGETTGDGILTALMMTKVLSETGEKLSTLKSIIKKSPQILVNFPATPAQKSNLKTSVAAKKLLLEFSEKLNAVSGRLLVRPSGTENLIRITMWGDDAEKIATLADELKTKLGEIL